MLEREFEILIRTLPRAFLPSGWVLIAQQLSLPSGRLDMLYSDKAGVRHVVELKKRRDHVEDVDFVILRKSGAAGSRDDSDEFSK